MTDSGDRKTDAGYEGSYCTLKIIIWCGRNVFGRMQVLCGEWLDYKILKEYRSFRETIGEKYSDGSTTLLGVPERPLIAPTAYSLVLTQKFTVFTSLIRTCTYLIYKSHNNDIKLRQ